MMKKSVLQKHTIDLQKVVNVSKVRHLSPFRYPGGKTWFVPHIKVWLSSLPFKPAVFIEPFAGGGIIGLTVAAENLADKIILSEIDEQIADVWKTILNGNAEWLATEISNFELTLDNVDLVLTKIPDSTKERAFQTILKNRINHGGIIAPGAGRIKSGENGKGLSSRWYPDTLRQRILAINAIRHRIEFVQGDGLDLINRYNSDCKSVFFIDPPYTAGGKRAGKRLYSCFDIDHPRLFEIASKISGDFLMTYENSEEIKELAKRFGFDMREVAMQNTHHAKMKELLISPNMGWVKADTNLNTLNKTSTELDL